MSRLVFGVKVLNKNMRLLMFDGDKLYPDIRAEKDYYSDSESESEISSPGPYHTLNDYRPESIFGYQILHGTRVSRRQDGDYIISLQNIYTGYMSPSSKHQTKLYPEQTIAYCTFINKLKEDGRIKDTYMQLYQID